MLRCYNRGCGQTYDPEQNQDDSCCHHPGAPYFHDAYKGWSCCNKKSVDFTEFLNIKGCTLSKHSNVKPPEPEKPQKSAEEVAAEREEVVVVRAPIRAPMERPAVDTPMVTVRATVAPALKDAIDSLKAQSQSAASLKAAAVDEISVGTACKNSGCTYSYSGTAADAGECLYHSGVPVFHEGMKFWSCCQRRTTDFAVFMAQKGCVSGEHKWFKENDDQKTVQCRYDWHQTPTNVIVSIYAKAYHYAQSSVEVNPVRLHVNLVFPAQQNASFDLDLELRGVIDVSKTSVQMNASKLEITLVKAEPGSWPKLDFPRDKLPAARKTDEAKVTSTASKQRRGSDSDDGFNLDDIETVNNGFRLADISSDNKNDLD